MAYTAFTTSSNVITQLVFQPGHGFTVGQLVRYDGTEYVLSLADSEADCAGTLMVSIVIDTANFYVTQTGYVSISTGSFTPGIQYYLSPTVPGELTSAKPIVAGQVALACFVPDSATTGFFWGGSGEQNTATDLFDWSTIGLSQTLDVNQGYWVNGIGSLDLLLPAIVAEGDTIQIWDIGGNGFTLKQNAGQYCFLGSGATTVGVGGSIISTMRMAKLTIVCQGADTIFAVNVDQNSVSTV